jgi:hypothetical protein
MYMFVSVPVSVGVWQLLAMSPPVPGLESSLFPSPATLHLTLAMLKLYSDEARHRTATTLAALQPALQVRGLGVQMGGGGMVWGGAGK